MVYSTTVRILKDKNLENLKKELEVLSKSKFNNINFGFTEIQNLLDEEIDLKPIADKLKELNLTSTTGHAPIHWPFTFNDYYNRPDRETLEKRILKSIKLSKLFDIEWLVIHIGTYYDKNGKYDIEESIKYNKKYLDKFVKCANKNGIKIAIENGTNQIENKETAPHVEELIELVDYFNNEYEKEILGICFDFGHANVEKVDIYNEIKKMGKKLKVTHIHDNFGKDDHFFPYDGNINWNLAMKALKEIDYQGELNLEVRYDYKMEQLQGNDTIPIELINYTYELLERLRSLMNNLDESNFNVICPKKENKEYMIRKGAYAIIKIDENKIAIAKENQEYFFLGGGLEKGENELDALKREFIEETGYTLKNIKYLNRVKSYEYSDDYGDLEIIATIYTAEFDKKITEKIENNEIIVCAPKDYLNKIKYEYQRYVLKKYINQTK